MPAEDFLFGSPEIIPDLSPGLQHMPRIDHRVLHVEGFNVHRGLQGDVQIPITGRLVMDDHTILASLAAETIGQRGLAFSRIHCIHVENTSTSTHIVLGPVETTVLRQQALRSGQLAYPTGRQAELVLGFFDESNNEICRTRVIVCLTSPRDLPESGAVYHEAIGVLLANNAGNPGLLRAVYNVTAVVGSIVIPGHALNGVTMSWSRGTARQHLSASEDLLQAFTAIVGELEPSTDETEDLTCENTPRSSRRFGIELEFDANRVTQRVYAQGLTTMLLQQRSKYGLLNTGYDHSRGDCWHLKTDSSCGLELAGPAMSWGNWAEFKAVLAKLRELGAKITPMCGLHVHHDVSDFTEIELRRLLLLWAAFEKTMFALVKSDRAQNHYCEWVTGDPYETFENLRDHLVPTEDMRNTVAHLGKYRSLNCTNYWRNATIEVRLHHGTLLPGAIKFWVAITQALVELALVEKDYSELEEAYAESVKTQFELLKTKIADEEIRTTMSVAMARRNPAALTEE